MDSLNKATSSEGACASLSEGSTSEPHNSAFGSMIWNTTPLQGETFPVADSAARATVHLPEVVPTDLLTSSGARPGKGIKRNLHHQHHLTMKSPRSL